MGIRVGIAIREFNELSNWELRIIQEILDDSNLELSLLIKEKTGETPITKHLSTSALGRLLLKSQFKFEQQVLFKSQQTVQIDILKKELDKVNRVHNPKNPLDVILNLSNGEWISGAAQYSKNGVWTLLHKNSTVENEGAVGFWEALHNLETIGCSILVNYADSDKNFILDEAHFNRHWSSVESKNMVLEASVSVLLKNLKGLKSESMTNNVDLKEFIARGNPPSLYQVLGYLKMFYASFIGKMTEKFRTKLFGTRFECWTLKFGQGAFLDASPSDYKTVNLPKGEFWADPFLFHHKGVDYIFFENYSYQTNRGKISCGRIENNELTQIEDVLDLDYHLSYPFIFEEAGEVYLMPETSENKRLEIYKATEFPTKWELHTTAFEGEAVADAFFYTDKQNEKWLFLNKQVASTAPMNSELYIYKIDSFKLDNLRPHVQNPVIIDARVARNGGTIFEYNGELYRPSQRNIDGIYGRALNINKIKELNLESYVEENSQIIMPDIDGGFVAMHHLHQTENSFVIDTAHRKI